MDVSAENYDSSQNENGYMALFCAGRLPEQLATGHLYPSQVEKEKVCKVAALLFAGASGLTSG